MDTCPNVTPSCSLCHLFKSYAVALEILVWEQVIFLYLKCLNLFTLTKFDCSLKSPHPFQTLRGWFFYTLHYLGPEDWIAILFILSSPSPSFIISSRPLLFNLISEILVLLSRGHAIQTYLDVHLFTMSSYDYLNIDSFIKDLGCWFTVPFFNPFSVSIYEDTHSTFCPSSVLTSTPMNFLLCYISHQFSWFFFNKKILHPNHKCKLFFCPTLNSCPSSSPAQGPKPAKLVNSIDLQFTGPTPFFHYRSLYFFTFLVLLSMLIHNYNPSFENTFNLLHLSHPLIFSLQNPNPRWTQSHGFFLYACACVGEHSEKKTVQ